MSDKGNYRNDSPEIKKNCLFVFREKVSRVVVKSLKDFYFEEDGRAQGHGSRNAELVPFESGGRPGNVVGGGDLRLRRIASGRWYSLIGF